MRCSKHTLPCTRTGQACNALNASVMPLPIMLVCAEVRPCWASPAVAAAATIAGAFWGKNKGHASMHGLAGKHAVGRAVNCGQERPKSSPTFRAPLLHLRLHLDNLIPAVVLTSNQNQKALRLPGLCGMAKLVSLMCTGTWPPWVPNAGATQSASNPHQMCSHPICSWKLMATSELSSKSCH
eukprot:scaffold114820_cov17-Tisochrysis_lutea.AAC.2